VAGLKQNGIPLYIQLEEIFSERIASGEWKVGKTLPNETQLCKEFDVSRGPVRQALNQLVREGILNRKQGRGTVVLPPKIENDLSSFYSFTTLIEHSHMRPSMCLLAFETVSIEGNAAKQLNLTSGTRVFKIRRLRLADDEPLILETVYVPEYICAGLNENEITTAPLYKILKDHYGVTLLRSKQFFEPTVANEIEAQVLEIRKEAPVLLIQNVSYAIGNRPVVFSKAVMRGDRVRYYVELNAPIDNS
jgi:GntR family transcriptional regulator